ncbi:hypothetical protein M413DRAFT_21957 [Hebeloma cylindrosporum]|uniref:F-box domain-containing protein n=1 Tax=Hebeloma cylindrosporum TaxID=76867 RepID=A0A0C3CMA4_HEBCY|nr:hypothetical protein M413DRAFT_21957 [Hebeloma cylindrosporum h7]
MPKDQPDVFLMQHHHPMNFGAPWLTNLNSLTLNSITTLSVLLGVCSRMPSIENLHLNFGTTGPGIDRNLRSVNMPLLTSLDISCPLDISLTFLDHITPAPGCNLHLFSNVSGSLEIMTPAEVDSAQRIIMKFAKNYFSHRGSTSFFLQISPETISAADFCPKVGPISTLHPRFEGFRITIYDRHTGRLPPCLFALFLGTFVPAHCVKKLILDSTYIRHALVPVFTDFLAMMTAVEMLGLTTDGLEFINSLPGVHFPLLKTIIWIPCYTSESPDNDNMESLIINFLAMRRKIGMPIETLDFSPCTYLSVPMDIQILEAEAGLRVVWLQGVYGYRREYVCGSGRPEELPTTISRSHLSSVHG